MGQVIGHGESMSRWRRLARAGCSIGMLTFVLVTTVVIGGGEGADECSMAYGTSGLATTYPFNSC